MAQDNKLITLMLIGVATLAATLPATARLRTAWQAVLDDYLARGFIKQNISGLHIWSSRTGTGNMVLWTDMDQSGYNCGPRADDGFARCEEYDLATCRFVQIRHIKWNLPHYEDQKMPVTPPEDSEWHYVPEHH
jgi:hypothetical protein